MTTPPDQPYGTPPGGGASFGPDQPGYGGMGSIPAPPGQWAGPPLAEWPLRALSFLIDAAIMGVPYYVLVLALDAPLLAWVVYTALFFYIQYVQGTTGQSPGKKVAKTTLLREADGQPLGFGMAVVRGILHFVDGLSCGVGFFWPIWDAKRQTFADKIVSSVVIREQ